MTFGFSFRVVEFLRLDDDVFVAVFASSRVTPAAFTDDFETDLACPFVTSATSTADFEGGFSFTFVTPSATNIDFDVEGLGSTATCWGNSVESSLLGWIVVLLHVGVRYYWLLSKLPHEATFLKNFVFIAFSSFCVFSLPPNTISITNIGRVGMIPPTRTKKTTTMFPFISDGL